MFPFLPTLNFIMGWLSKINTEFNNDGLNNIATQPKTYTRA